MKPDLLKIPSVEPPIHEPQRQIRVFTIDGKSKVYSDLEKWATSEKQDFKKVVHAMRVTAETPPHQLIHPKYVKPCSHPDCEGIFEFRAHGRSARVMFFYDNPTLIVCTNCFWKSTSAKQTVAFKESAEIRNYWNQLKKSDKNEHYITSEHQ